MGALSHVKPLNIDRAKLLAKIQANLAAEKAAREAEAAKQSAAQKEVTDFVAANAEKIANYFHRNVVGGSWGNTLEGVTETSKPGRLESELEKYARVLDMSADDSVEVFPGHDVYDLI